MTDTWARDCFNWTVCLCGRYSLILGRGSRLFLALKKEKLWTSPSVCEEMLSFSVFYRSFWCSLQTLQILSLIKTCRLYTLHSPGGLLAAEEFRKWVLCQKHSMIESVFWFLVLVTESHFLTVPVLSPSFLSLSFPYSAEYWVTNTLGIMLSRTTQIFLFSLLPTFCLTCTYIIPSCLTWNCEPWSLRLVTVSPWSKCWSRLIFCIGTPSKIINEGTKCQVEGSKLWWSSQIRASSISS